MRFLESTVTFGPIWLAQDMRNKNPNLMVQPDWTKSDRASQKMHLKNLSVILLCVGALDQVLYSNVCDPKT